MKKAIVCFTYLALFLVGLNLQSQTTTYSVLSTAYNRATGTFFPLGAVDNGWFYTRIEDLVVPNNPASVILYPNNPTYVVSNAGNNTFPGIIANHSINMAPNTTSLGLKLFTYRTYFTLPNLLTTSNRYSLSFKLSADDAVHEVRLNGTQKAQFLSNTYNNVPGINKPYMLTVPICDTDFVSGLNYIDVVVADAGGSVGYYGEVTLFQTVNPSSSQLFVTSSCNGNTGSAVATLTTAVANPTVFYFWTDASGVLVSQTNNTASLSNTVSNLPNGTYTVQTQVNGTCGAIATQTITVNCVSTPPLCSGNLGAPVFFEDFGSGASLYGAALPAGVTSYPYMQGVPNNGTYVIASSSNPSGTNAGYVNDGDHTGNPNGYMMVVNSDYAASEVYRKHVTGLCPGTTYVFSAYLANNNSPDAVINVCATNYVYANIKFQTEFPVGTVINSTTSGNLAVATNSVTLPWIQYGFAFTTGPGQTSVDVVLKNNAPGGCGNDYAVDDISLSPCGPGVSVGIVPTQTVFCQGDPVSFQSNFTSGSYTLPQYQWQYSGDGGVTWSNITGATSPNYNIPSVTTSQGGMYQLLVSESGNINLPSCRIIAGPLTFSLDINCISSTASFLSPDTVCVNQNFNITNTSIGANSHYWTFCQSNTNLTPQATNLGNIGFFNGPVFSTIAKDGSDYYAFITNNSSSTLTKLFFGSSLLNIPVPTNLGNVSGAFPNSLEDLHLEFEGGNWYGIAVGGFGGTESIIRLDFGSSLANVPTAVSMGNIGGMDYPQRLKIFKNGSNYYGFTTNRNNNTITRFSFGNSIANIPVGLNLGNIGSLNTPDAIALINVTNTWYGFIINEGSNTLTRLDFGASLLNTPTGTNLGNTGALNGPRGIDMWTECNEIRGLITNRFSDDLLNMNLSAGPTGPVVTSSFGNIANFSFPHSITRFRSGDTLFAFITNVGNNTLSRIYYPGCVNSSIASSTLTSPLPVSYNAPGTYYINLLINEGQITQTNYCKQVTVINTPTIVVSTASMCAGASVTLTASGATTYSWNAASNLSSPNGSAVIATPGVTETFTVTGAISSCTNTATTTVSVIANPTVAITGNTLICAGESTTLTANGTGNYMWNTTSTSPDIFVNPGITQTYSVLTSNGSCTNSAIATVSVVPIPTISLSPDSTICEGSGTATLTANGAVSYTWINASSLSSPTGAVVMASPNTTTNYTVTGAVGLCTNTAVVTVSVNPSPTITATSVINTSCGLANGSATVNSSPAGNSYTWSTGVSSTTSTAASLSSGVYTVTAINGVCYTNTVVNVLSSVGLQITASTITPTDCGVNNGSIVVMDNNVSSIYSWNPTASTSNTITNLATGSYTVLITNAACTTSSVFVVPQLSGPTLINVIQQNAICESSNGALSITNVVNGVSPYIYSLNNSGFSAAGTYSNLSQGIYTITVKDVNGCVYSQNYVIDKVIDQTQIQSVTNRPTCNTNDGSLTISSINGGTTPYLIKLNDTPYSALTTFEQLGIGNYTLTVLDSNSCVTNFVIEIALDKDDYTLYVPNTFTPNNDTKNDAWFAKATCINAFNCLIFNRWGEKIAELNDIYESWDGTYHGKSVPEGVYVYLIEAETNNGTIHKTGHITLFR
ncbi:MAG: gliding motility-associated C-terminal domain-containing protein [Bacteroidota bacterium]